MKVLFTILAVTVILTLGFFASMIPTVVITADNVCQRMILADGSAENCPKVLPKRYNRITTAYSGMEDEIKEYGSSKKVERILANNEDEEEILSF